jgi:hypothetical protein
MYPYYVFKLYMNIVWCFVEVEYDIRINYKTQVVEEMFEDTKEVNRRHKSKIPKR